MKMKKKVLFMLSGLFLLSASLVYAYNSNEAQKFFTNTCAKTNVKGIEAAVCNLYQRVVALEARPIWDENRIAALEARVAALENPTPPPPPVCTAMLCDNFNSYSDGSIVGQGGWTDRVNGEAFLVEGATTNEGSKALHNTYNDGDSIVTKTGTTQYDGRQSIYIRTENRSSWGAYDTGNNLQVRLSNGSWDGAFRIDVAFFKDGHIAYNGTVDPWVTFGTYNDNAWNLLDIEWRSSDHKARYRINGGTWTNWDTYNGASSFNGVNNIGFEIIHLGTGGAYIDTLQ